MNPIHLELSREEIESPEYRRFETDADYPYCDEGLYEIFHKWSIGKSRKSKKNRED